jgi:large subunit ribosomal protein L24
MKIHTGDTVVIITGKDKGKSGRVMKILKEKNRVVVEGINMRIRHIKKTAQGPGQRLSYEASLHASNVMIVDPKTKKPARIGFKMDEKKGKVRIAKGSGEMITKAAKAAPAKGAKKADGEVKVKEAPKSDAKPTKQPFWKRGGEGNPEAGDQKVSETKTGGAASMPSAHRSQGG